MLKRLAIVMLMLGATGVAIAQTNKNPPAKATGKPASSNKYNDNVDDRMKGPKGEKVYIGPNGGRYYLKDGKKVYVEYNGGKKKKG
jgi:hypothetical protein